MGEAELIIGCGILKKEIRLLAEKNGWHQGMTFLPSALHVDFHKLQKTLEKSLQLHAGEPAIVFYGACHPRMDQMLDAAHVTRTPGQNCVDIYLGHETFCRELEQGAFFLFEEWAHHWKEIVGAIMPGDPEIMRSIFCSAHKYLLAIRTPCSGDFSAEAEKVSALTSLELRWVDAGLEHLEANLAATLDRAKTGRP
jgi:hypothetical protein